MKVSSGSDSEREDSGREDGDFPGSERLLLSPLLALGKLVRAVQEAGVTDYF